MPRCYLPCSMFQAMLLLLLTMILNLRPTMIQVMAQDENKYSKFKRVPISRCNLNTALHKMSFMIVSKT